jgi:U3 small nucleolar RNA-associated protein 14
MGGRQAHGGKPTKAPKARTKKNRAMNAFAIASQQHPEKIKVKYHRLGESEGGNRPTKRARTRDSDDDEEDEEEESHKKKRKAPSKKGRFDELDLEEGSDSEGNEWKMGQVDSDDDSDLDSDEAFGESDEEKFEGFAFSGSTEKSKKVQKKKNGGGVNLDENEESEEEDSDDDSLGEDAIDLAAMLDATEGDDLEDVDHPTEDEGEGSDMESPGDSEDSDEESSNYSMDEDDSGDDPDKILALQNLIANLPQSDSATGAAVRRRNNEASEYATPSDFGVTTKNKLTLEDLGLPAVQDKFVKKSLKLLAAEAKSETNKNGVSGKLAVPLAKRQQDKLDRSAAYDKTKETLERWTDTVKNNRRAEHLMFPLPDADHASMVSNTKLQPTTGSKPFNELEATIQSILEESGLATVNGRTDEDKIAEFEELETKKMSLEEVKARRDQLRMARELMFREEARSKRIKKIKSKSYRRVHRKQREKEERLNKEALLEAGIEPSEDEQEAQDRRRAEERMGSKHRGSKWAKATKQTGRAAWDEDARAGINEMAIRDEELRKRVEGRSSRKEGVDDDEELSDSEDYDSDDDEELGDAQLLKKLEAANGVKSFSEAGMGSRLSNMKFMLKADAARRQENDQTVEQMRRELAGESSESESELLGDVGRRTFGPGSQNALEKDAARFPKKNEFEEPEGSDVEFDEEPSNAVEKRDEKSSRASINDKPGNAKARVVQISKSTVSSATTFSDPTHEGGAWSQVKSKKDAAGTSDARRRKQKAQSSNAVDELDLTNAAMIAAPFKKPAKPKAKKTTSIELHVSADEDSDDDVGPNLPFAIRDQALIARAFAGADVVGEFEAEKRQTIEDEDEQIVDNTLPGWGSWTGEGLSKKAKARNKGRFLTKTEGIKEKDRKDAKLDKVIINEKRVKKVCRSIRVTFYKRAIANMTFRMLSTLLAVSLIRSRQKHSTSAHSGYLLVQSGQRRKRSKTQRSREFCLNRALLHRCQSRFYRLFVVCICRFNEENNGVTV